MRNPCGARAYNPNTNGIQNLDLIIIAKLAKSEIACTRRISHAMRMSDDSLTQNPKSISVVPYYWKFAAAARVLPWAIPTLLLLLL
jgi:hypothetical protein